MNGNSPRGSRGSGPWLPAALQLHIFSLLPPNDRALSCRLVSPDAADSLSGPENCTASLSQPLPPHAAAWAAEAGQQHVRQLPFRQKLQLMCTAATSGSEVNLEVTLALLQPSVSSEVLQSVDLAYERRFDGKYCSGGAAAKAGHPQLLQWLVHRCPGLLSPMCTLKAVAKHCNLAGLQTAWKVLQHGFVSSSCRLVLTQGVLDAAAESPTLDAVAKMEWMLGAEATGGGGERPEGGLWCRLKLSTAAAAAGSGDLGRLRWLRDRGCRMGRGSGPWWGEPDVLEAALQHADLAVAQWLVDEAGYELPAAVNSGNAGEETDLRDMHWADLLEAAAESPDAVAKWQWLQERGGPSVAGADGGLVKQLALAAVRAGQVEGLQYLLSVLGAGKVLAVGREALSEAVGRAGSIPVAECLQQAGLVLSPRAYTRAAGQLPFVRWLALEARVSPNTFACTDIDSMMADWPDSTPAHSRDLLEAVQLLAGAGFSDWGGERLSYTAARRGDVDLFMFLMKQITPLDPDMRTVAAAADAGCLPLLQFLAAQLGCFKPSAIPSSSQRAAGRGDRATLDALRRLGVP